MLRFALVSSSNAIVRAGTLLGVGGVRFRRRGLHWVASNGGYRFSFALLLMLRCPFLFLGYGPGGASFLTGGRRVTGGSRVFVGDLRRRQLRHSSKHVVGARGGHTNVSRRSVDSRCLCRCRRMWDGTFIISATGCLTTIVGLGRRCVLKHRVRLAHVGHCHGLVYISGRTDSTGLSAGSRCGLSCLNSGGGGGLTCCRMSRAISLLNAGSDVVVALAACIVEVVAARSPGSFWRVTVNPVATIAVADATFCAAGIHRSTGIARISSIDCSIRIDSSIRISTSFDGSTGTRISVASSAFIDASIDSSIGTSISAHISTSIDGCISITTSIGSNTGSSIGGIGDIGGIGGNTGSCICSSIGSIGGNTGSCICSSIGSSINSTGASPGSARSEDGSHMLISRNASIAIVLNILTSHGFIKRWLPLGLLTFLTCSCRPGF